eukprot:794744-Amphidinium_carterae.1
MEQERCALENMLAQLLSLHYTFWYRVDVVGNMYMIIDTAMAASEMWRDAPSLEELLSAAWWKSCLQIWSILRQICACCAKRSGGQQQRNGLLADAGLCEQLLQPIVSSQCDGAAQQCHEELRHLMYEVSSDRQQMAKLAENSQDLVFEQSYIAEQLCALQHQHALLLQSLTDLSSKMRSHGSWNALPIVSLARNRVQRHREYTGRVMERIKVAAPLLATEVVSQVLMTMHTSPLPAHLGARGIWTSAWLARVLGCVQAIHISCGRYDELLQDGDADAVRVTELSACVELEEFRIDHKGRNECVLMNA